MKVHHPAHRVVWLHSHFLHWMGGTKYIYEVIKQWQNNRSEFGIHEVVVVVEQASPLATKMYQDLGVELIVLGGSTSVHPWYWLFLPWFLEERHHQLQTLFKERKWSSTTTTVISSMFPMNVVAQKLQVKHVQLCYEPFAFFYDQAFVAAFSPLKRWFIKLIAWLYQDMDKQAVRAADQVLTLNQVTKNVIREVYQVTADLVYAGVDTARFKPGVSTVLKNAYRNQSVLIHSTDYSPVKGTDRVIKALPKVVTRVPNVCLLITTTIMNKTAEQRLRQLARSLGVEDHVTFLGFVSAEELPEYYALAQVLIQGSNSLRSGTTSMALPVKEAMACGTPAIRPKAGGEDVVDGVSGWLVDPSQTTKLANTIIKALNNPNLTRQMGKVARKTILQKYTWDKVAERIASYV